LTDVRRVGGMSMSATTLFLPNKGKQTLPKELKEDISDRLKAPSNIDTY